MRIGFEFVMAVQHVEPQSKQRVAARAAALINPGDRVILDGGTTTLALVRAVPARPTATVITHSPTIAAALVDHPAIEILMLGGRIYKHSAVTCGAATAEAAAMKRTLAARAADTYVLASTEKVGAISPYKVLGLGDVTAIITDAAPDNPVLAQLSDGGTAVISAAP